MQGQDKEKVRAVGLAVGCAIGGLGVGIMVLALPFVTPALRKFVLPFVPATSVQLESVARYLAGRRGKVVDLGSGDGRVVSVREILSLMNGCQMCLNVGL